MLIFLGGVENACSVHLPPKAPYFIENINFMD